MVDVWVHRSRSLKDTAYAEWGEARETFNRSVGQSTILQLGLDYDSTNCDIAKYARSHTSKMDSMGLIKLLVMDRDRRLTGYLRGQTDTVEAPVGFELNNPWRASLLLSGIRYYTDWHRLRNDTFK